ncbi:MAG: type II toxin-antitoxin system RelE/ParE family toxin [Verrucomicrobiota bacterium]
MPEAFRTAQANLDLVEIWSFIAADNPDAADQLLETIDEKAKLLAQSPELGRKRSDLAPSLRSFPVGNYLIFYRPDPNGIEIIRVLHGARDLPGLFE